MPYLISQGSLELGELDNRMQSALHVPALNVYDVSTKTYRKPLVYLLTYDIKINHNLQRLSADNIQGIKFSFVREDTRNEDRRRCSRRH